MLNLSKKAFDTRNRRADRLAELRDAAVELVIRQCKLEGNFQQMPTLMEELFDLLYEKTADGRIIKYQVQGTGEQLAGGGVIEPEWRPQFKPVGEQIAILENELADYSNFEIGNLARCRREARLRKPLASGTPQEREAFEQAQEVDRPEYANAEIYKANRLDEALKVLEGEMDKLNDKGKLTPEQMIRLDRLQQEYINLTEKRQALEV